MERKRRRRKPTRREERKRRLMNLNTDEDKGGEKLKKQ